VTEDYRDNRTSLRLFLFSYKTNDELGLDVLKKQQEVLDLVPLSTRIV
jgi:hypothetical protein